MENRMELKFAGLSVNEGFARVVAGAFAAQLDPTLEEVADIKTAVSEAVTNAIIHAYPDAPGDVVMRAWRQGREVTIEVEDTGRGIPDTDRAMEPFYTTAEGDERSGMGFTVMQTFMDEVRVKSVVGQGTTVTMTKRLAGGRVEGRGQA